MILWERKITLEKEIQDAVDPNIGQVNNKQQTMRMKQTTEMEKQTSKQERRNERQYKENK